MFTNIHGKLFILCILTAFIKTQHSEEEEDINDINGNSSHNERTGRILFPTLINSNAYSNSESEQNEEYDFIIVGSGSAGSVLANRLSEFAHWRILLIEVGHEPTPIVEIPAIAALFQFTDLNWGYLMEKQENVALGMIDQRMSWPRGRALGGTTTLNYMIHVRGNRRDYDKWAAMGNPGWSFADVLPYFKKLEHFNVRHQEAQYHSHNGPLSVEDVPYRTEAAHAFVRACQEAGLPYVDYNGAEQLGVSFVHATLQHGRRCSAERAFLRPIRGRKNLTVLTGSRVVRVLIDPATKRAYGVQYVRRRRLVNATATKEVILSAGAFGSPQLLMLSGIGPEHHLRQLGIPVLRSLPVGDKLYDHLSFVGLVFTVDADIVSRQQDLESANAFIQFLLSGQGPLTSLGGVEALAYVKTNVSDHTSPLYPDIELIFVSGSMNTDKGQWYRKTFRITDEIYNRIWKPLENRHVWSVFPMLVHPKSYGRLRLKSANPYHWPILEGNYFTDPDNADMKTFIASIREIQRIAKSPSLQQYNTQIVQTPIPGCQHRRFDTDQYWECALRHLTQTLHHQISTCKMGPPNDTEAVVDHRLRVYGIKNLRVVDTSIIPLPLTAHTNGPAYMIGEKAADLIKEEWLQADFDARKIDIRSALDNLN